MRPRWATTASGSDGKSDRSPPTQNMRPSAATTGPLAGILDVFEDEWTSARIVGDPHSSIVDLPLTLSFNGMVSVAGWYDNVAGFSLRLAETAARLAS